MNDVNKNEYESYLPARHNKIIPHTGKNPFNNLFGSFLPNPSLLYDDMTGSPPALETMSINEMINRDELNSIRTVIIIALLSYLFMFMLQIFI